MGGTHESFRILYAAGPGATPTMLVFDGAPEDSARRVIAEVLSAGGRAGDGDASDLKLSPADVVGDATDVWDTQFLILDGEETLRDLRAMIGPDDSKVLLRQGSWGDTQGPEIFLWAVNDFLPFARNLLEIYGAVEVMKTAGRAIEARRNRETRREAEFWVRGGYGEIHGLLRDEVMQYRSWPVVALRKQFGLNDGDAGRLMSACGYEYDPATETYYLLG